MSGIPTPLDQTELKWRDNVFLQQFPLNQHTVLDYFSRSDFYDEACNNAECRRQGLNPDEALRCAKLERVAGCQVLQAWSTDQHRREDAPGCIYVQLIETQDCCRTMAPGIEYVLTFVQEPSLYVIKRQYRTSPDSAVQQAFYYCLYGDIFQAPTLLACIQARTERCKYHMEQVFDRLKSDLEPLGWRTRHRNRKIKRAKRQHDTAIQNQGVESRTLDDERLDIEIARAAVDNGAIELNTAADGTGLENELEHEGVRLFLHHT